jgi:hypothetical protein
MPRRVECGVKGCQRQNNRYNRQIALCGGGLDYPHDSLRSSLSGCNCTELDVGRQSAYS